MNATETPHVQVFVTPYVLRSRGTRREVVNATTHRLRAGGARMSPEAWQLVEGTYDDCVEAYMRHPDAPPERLVRYLTGVTAHHEDALVALFTEMRHWLEAHHG